MYEVTIPLRYAIGNESSIKIISASLEPAYFMHQMPRRVGRTLEDFIRDIDETISEMQTTESEEDNSE